MKRKFLILFSTACVLFILPACGANADGSESTENYPSESITYSIPFDPGGQSDVEARRQQPYLEESLDQDVVMQYKPGGGGSVGWSELINKDPDGHFISGINIPHIILQPLANDDTGYQTEDIVPVAIFQATPIGIAVSKDSDIESLEDLVKKAKESPGSITAAGSGTYSGHHIALLQLQDLAGIEMQYVPFDGAAPSIQAFLGGNAEVIFGNSSDLIKYQDDMKILAIGSEETFKPLPDVPTFKELGYDMTAGIDRGVAVPPETSQEIIETLEKAFLDILDEDGVEDDMYDEGFEPKRMGHEESLEYIEQKQSEYSKILENVEEN
ncbi:Tripartite-type tricarboxylate transporter, receptor component TctC [Lentibacillus halodurans]|uniref:Tripartite-type tricarboxylate transporter, receptor component TctC n=1 Tax=Lentibacillus halodurans TaxID=237679 RepID=A0A1I0XE72_9BACI|nr:tripartite tricarboxylate transporter substrate binding protein [Lentibacillus halodurans]SFA99301.1 Tripartite-type tricarboxylate transporter, receptor component TctC [Lentibacillus halodurans]